MISVIRPPVIVPWSLIHSIFILGKIAQLLWAFHFGLLIGLKETKNVNFLEECLAPGNQSLVAIVIPGLKSGNFFFFLTKSKSLVDKTQF